MSEEDTFASYPQKVVAKDVAVDDHIFIYGIPCWAARIRQDKDSYVRIEGYGFFTHDYHEKTFRPDDEIEIPVVIRGDISVYPNY